MIRKLRAAFALFAFACLAEGAPLPDSVVIDDRGTLILNGTPLQWVFFGPEWQAWQIQKGVFTPVKAPLRQEGKVAISGDWKFGPGHVFRTDTFVESLGGNRFRYRSRLTASQAPVGVAVALMLTMPAGEEGFIEVDGNRVKLPAAYEGAHPWNSDFVRSLALNVGDCRFRIVGDFGLLVQDNRQWTTAQFQFRLMPVALFPPYTDVTLDLVVETSGGEPEAKAVAGSVEQLDLDALFNMGFRDERAGDGKGGWTDQGPANDLAMMKPGMIECFGLPLRVTDPARNSGKSCLVISKEQGKFPASAEITLAPAAAGKRFLYLLHASAWTPPRGAAVGKIVAEYKKGSAREFPVLAGRDCGNWWQPRSLTNGAVAWVGENNEAFVGLYLSQFEIPGEPVKLRFVPEGAGPESPVWMIVAAALGDSKLELAQADTPCFLTAGEHYTELEFSGKTVPGSPLDFSGSLDAPAGKHGPVTVTKSGHFSFRDAPGKRIRFFGANLVGDSSFLEKASADDFVEKIARLGYNSIRFHHFENTLVKRKAPDSLTFDPMMLDRFFYLFAALKERGVYSCLDIYASRMLLPGDGVGEGVGYEMKLLVPLSSAAMDNWKAFARKLLTEKNPYTGMSMAEDPALYSVNLINENPLLFIWDRYPKVVPLIEKRYYEYLKKKGMDTPENRANRSGPFIVFLNEVQGECIAEQMRFLREELKLTALVTDLNFINQYSLSGLRGKLDFVDNHLYWDHPGFPVRSWSLPYSFLQNSSIGGRAWHPRDMMATRIFGKPFTITEYNFCNPNRYRVEAPSLIGGYAGLQDWDGLYRFAWSHWRGYMEHPTPPVGFDIVNDPQAQMAERIIHALFVRGDVSAAKEAYAFHWKPEMVPAITGKSRNAAPYPYAFTLLGLYGRIGTLNEGDTFPAVKKLDVLAKDWRSALPPKARNACAELEDKGTVTSATGEISLDASRKTMKIVTPRSEVFTFADSAAGDVVSLANGSLYQTVALISLDESALKNSKKMLLIHLVNTGATMQKFSNERFSQLESWGHLPLLLARTRLDVSLKVAPGMKVRALKLDGSPNGDVQAVYKGGKLLFTADTAARPGGTMVYLISR